MRVLFYLFFLSLLCFFLFGTDYFVIICFSLKLDRLGAAFGLYDSTKGSAPAKEKEVKIPEEQLAGITNNVLRMALCSVGDFDNLYLVIFFKPLFQSFRLFY